MNSFSRIVLLAAVLPSLLAVQPANAGVADGVCPLVTITFTFTPGIAALSGLAGTVSMSGVSSSLVPCVTDETSNPPASSLKGFNFNSTSGSGVILTTCEGFVADGFFGANLGNGYAAGGGQWTAVGSFAGGITLWLDGGLFQAVGEALVLDPFMQDPVATTNSCLSTGKKTFVFDGSMVVGDPN